MDYEEIKVNRKWITAESSRWYFTATIAKASTEKWIQILWKQYEYSNLPSKEALPGKRKYIVDTWKVLSVIRWDYKWFAEEIKKGEQMENMLFKNPINKVWEILVSLLICSSHELSKRHESFVYPVVESCEKTSPRADDKRILVKLFAENK